MQSEIRARTSSNCRHKSGYVSQDNGLGQLFRDYGEKYIKTKRPNLIRIKLIKSIRVCRTPALGGKQYICKSCGENKYVYFGCGNSRCPICQGIKRLQWQDKLCNRLYKCPYQHIVFTMPSIFRGLTRRNPRIMYNILMRSAWESLKKCCKDPKNLGAIPGVIMVLHTFGSDLKYHIHVHLLVTFGGMTNQGEWKWPKRKDRIVRYRQIRNAFRTIFINQLKEHYGQMDTKISFEELIKDLLNKAWCVKQQPPTSNKKMIVEYLGKYINRIGLSIRRFKYDAVHKEVTLVHKDYRNQKSYDELPPLITKTLDPMTAIDHILQHCLPKYFQKTRYYGIHSNAGTKKYKEKLPKSIRSSEGVIRTIMQLIKAMLGMEALVCAHCGSDKFDKAPLYPDKEWKDRWLKRPYHNKDPVRHSGHTCKFSQVHSGVMEGYCPNPSKKNQKSTIFAED